MAFTPSAPLPGNNPHSGMEVREEDMRWPVREEDAEYLKTRQQENRARKVPAEDWMALKLKTTGLKWTRQASWGYRIFDFWNHRLGIAVEVDGTTHDAGYDGIRDAWNLERSGILVLRVRNYNEEDAERALEAIRNSESWNERRTGKGLAPVR